MSERTYGARDLLVAALLLTGACSPQSQNAPALSRWRVEVETLYVAAKNVEACAAVDRRHAPVSAASKEFVKGYVRASDWSKAPEQSRVVQAYGDAIPAPKSASANLQNQEEWVKIAQGETRQDMALKLADSANAYGAKAGDDLEAAVAKIREANRLHVAVIGDTTR